jgi:hypothetical protein
VATASKAGPLNVKSYGEADGLRNGPNNGSQTLWYPVNGKPPYAAVAIVPGWVSSERDIYAWGPFLASHGIVTLAIGTNNPAGDYPPEREAARLDALETMKAENTRDGGPLKAKLDLKRLGVVGWSMGGGGVMLAAKDVGRPRVPGGGVRAPSVSWTDLLLWPVFWAGCGARSPGDHAAAEVLEPGGLVVPPFTPARPLTSASRARRPRVRSAPNARTTPRSFHPALPDASRMR